MRLLVLWGAACLIFPSTSASWGDEPSKAQPSKQSVETWAGPLKVRKGLELDLIFTIETDKDGKKSATMDSPEQNAVGIKVDSYTRDDAVLKFEVKSIRGTFEGKIRDSGKKAVGTWTQGTETFELTLDKIEKPTGAPKLFAKETIWEGKLEADAGIKIRLVFHVVPTSDGKFAGSLDSPDQGAMGLKASAVSLDPKAIKLDWKALGAAYEGKLNAKGDAATGFWKQSGAEVPLDIKLVEKPSEQRRPQTPHAPFPYKREEVTYKNEVGKTTLAGELTLPEGSGPFPAVIMISGSGAQDRDETILGHKPFFVIADALTKRGIAVLRVDDRGVGRSTGDTSKSTSADFAEDVLAGLTFLKSRKEIDPKKLGLIGHSEGGIVAPIVATKSPDVSYIVLMAGTGLTGYDIVILQGILISKAMGSSEEHIAKSLEIQKPLLAIVRDEKDPKARETKVADFMKTKLPEIAGKNEELKASIEATVKAQVAALQSPWFQYFLAYDPRPVLAKVQCPVLAINGEKDLQVPPRENLEAIEKALKSGGNTKFTVKELPSLNHLFQTAANGTPAEYATIEETIAPSALTLIGDWIVEQTGK